MPTADTQSATVSHVDPVDIADVERLIGRLEGLTPADREGDWQKMVLIVNFYQEQPHVLDPHLQGWIDKLLAVSFNMALPQLSTDVAFVYLYLLTKTRGEKYIVRLLPHEVSDIERVLGMLEGERGGSWQCRYILFLWLSVLVLIPFDLTRLDGDREQGWAVRRMLNLATSQLEAVDKSAEAASVIVAKLITRPDLHSHHLKSTLDTLIDTATTADSDAVFGSRRKLAMLRTLCRVYKLGRRDYILPYSESLLERLANLQLRKTENTLLRKYEIKLTQRIGLSFLAPRVAKWRYTRGTRLLADSLAKPELLEGGLGAAAKEEKEEEEEEYDVPEEIESVLDTLFRGLKDPETIVRWSAAKGIGRITARLPESLATEIVQTLLDCFSPLETASSWHGGCLALAELGRHGFLRPENLAEVVPVLVAALQYDERRGNMIIGANVRDAACYLSWSFARTFDPSQIAPFVREIASALILTTLFDKHIGVRRAASAAFQENVGRQGTFPHGIDILTTCDYYAVALQSNTYHNLSLKVARFEPYTKAIIDHLTQCKSAHWCPTIRRDAGKALGLLCSVSPDYLSDTVLPYLLARLRTGDVNARHGSLYAIGHVCVGLRSAGRAIPAGCVEEISGVLSLLEERSSFKGSAGDEMRGALCFFIERVSEAGLVLAPTPSWQAFIDLCLVNPEQVVGVQEMAVAALRPFAALAYPSSHPPDLLSRYSEAIFHEITATRVGAALAISVLPAHILRPQLKSLVQLTAEGTTVRSKAEVSLAECRVACVEALTHLLLVGQPNCGTRQEIYQVLLRCMEDYTTDSRGDIGSYVREAAMRSLKKINKHIIDLGHPIINLTLTSELKLALARGFLQQSLEKIDRTRQVAVSALYHLVTAEGGPDLPEREWLRECLPTPAQSVYSTQIDANCEVVDGSLAEPSEEARQFDYQTCAPPVLFPPLMHLLASPTYRHSVMRGLLVSVGGLTESLVKASSAALIDYLTEQEEMVEEVCTCLLDILERDRKNDRVTVPLFKTLELVLNNVLLEEKQGNAFAARFTALTKIEVHGSGNVAKLLAALNPLSSCVQFPENKPVLSQTMLLLCHRYPRVRKGMADSLYTALITFDDAIERCEEVVAILESTVWEDPSDIEALRGKRNEICALVGVPVPKKTGKKVVRVQQAASEQFDSYSDLVGRAGY